MIKANIYRRFICAQHCYQCFACINSLDPDQSPMRYALLFSSQPMRHIQLKWLAQDPTPCSWWSWPWIQVIWLHCPSEAGRLEHSGGRDRLWHTHVSAVWRASCMQVPRGFLGLPLPLGERREPPTASRLPHPCSCPALLPPAPLIDLTPTHSGSAMLMLLSVVFVGLAVFVIYKFKRYVCLCPWLPAPFFLRDRFRSTCCPWCPSPAHGSDGFC